MSRFNLIDEEWIPVRFLDGNRGELGIQDVLLGAKDIAALRQAVVRIQPFDQAEVGNFWRAVRLKEDVSWLEVAMHDLAQMGRVDRPRQGLRQRRSPLRRHRLAVNALKREIVE